MPTVATARSWNAAAIDATPPWRSRSFGDLREAICCAAGRRGPPRRSDRHGSLFFHGSRVMASEDAYPSYDPAPREVERVMPLATMSARRRIRAESAHGLGRFGSARAIDIALDRPSIDLHSTAPSDADNLDLPSGEAPDLLSSNRAATTLHGDRNLVHQRPDANGTAPACSAPAWLIAHAPGTAGRATWPNRGRRRSASATLGSRSPSVEVAGWRHRARDFAALMEGHGNRAQQARISFTRRQPARLTATERAPLLSDHCSRSTSTPPHEASTAPSTALRLHAVATTGRGQAVVADVERDHAFECRWRSTRQATALCTWSSRRRSKRISHVASSERRTCGRVEPSRNGGFLEPDGPRVWVSMPASQLKDMAYIDLDVAWPVAVLSSSPGSAAPPLNA